MPTISGHLKDVTTHPTAAREILVRASQLRAGLATVTTTETRSVPVSASGEVSFECEPGPAVMLIQYAKGAPLEVKLVASDAATQALGDAVAAFELADDATRDRLEELAVEVIDARNATIAARDAAKVSETNAKDSETSAAASKSAAATSETKAKASETASKTSETNAKVSETAAAGSATAAANSSSAANSAKTAAQAAQSGAETARGQAQTQASNAAGSATAAANSAAAAQTARTGAETAQASAASAATNAANAALASKADLVGGKVPSTQIPAVALTKPFPVASRAAMLALTAEEGDVATITGGADKGTYMLGAGASTAFASWIPLVSPDAPVQSVNGQAGTVNLGAADVGAAPASHTHTKDQVGLGNVDNTSDANKPVSTATASAIAGRAPMSHTHAEYVTKAGTATTVWAGTQAQYDALPAATKNAAGFIAVITA